MLNIFKISSSNVSFEFKLKFERPVDIQGVDSDLDNSFMILKCDQDNFSLICQRVFFNFNISSSIYIQFLFFIDGLL